MGRFLLFLLLCNVLAPGIALGKTWYVNPDGSGDALTIAMGINLATAGDTVEVAPGTYNEHDVYMKNGIHLTSETGTSDCVIIDAQDLGRIFYCNGCDSTTAIVGFTLTNGEIYFGRGGGMYVDGGAMEITNCSFLNNYCDSIGGGAFIYNASPVFTDCEFIANVGSPLYATSGGGGGACSYSSSVKFIGCDFTGNDAMGVGGGALYCIYGGDPVVSGCTFTDNHASYGGGIACGNCAATITGSTFDGNGAGEGGALNHRGAGYTMVVDNCVFTGNSAGDMGGAFIVELTDAVITYCEFYDNTAGTSGGAGQVLYDAGATISDCVFAGSRVTRKGVARVGGAMAIRDDSYGNLLRCTMCASSADYAGSGVSYRDVSTGSLDRCIIAYSEVSEALEWDETGTEPTIACCDLYGNEGGDWTGPIADQYGINGNISEDPLFCDRDRYDLHLAGASPCLNADTCGTIGALGYGCPVQRLVLETIIDAPNDYGGYVDVSWCRDGYDGAAGDTVVDYYTLWRRVDPLTSAPARGRRVVWYSLGDSPPGTWEFIDSVAATGQAEYTATCPTVQDSTEDGKGWSFFFVKAHCPSPPLEFFTPPDSGYSIWNLSDWTDVTTDPLGNDKYGDGFAWVDFDNDDDLDIFFTNRFSADKLYRNDSLTAEGFADATPALLGDNGNNRGPAWGDYDNDGDLDLYVCKRNATNRLYRNDGSGNFTDVSTSPLNDSGIGESASWVDYDNDGDVDLYLLNWGANKLFRNEGSGVFTDVTSGPLGNTAHSMGSSWADYDNDGDMDVYVANYEDTNLLLENQGGGIFVDVMTPVLEGPPNSMGISWADYDNDGDMDLYVTGEGPNSLFRNDGGVFTNVTSYPLDDDKDGRTGAWGDFDLDGDLDLYLVNDYSTNKLFRNLGGGTFARADSGQCPLSSLRVGYCTAWADYDKDGDLDLYVVNDDPNQLLRNELPAGHHWLEVRLQGDCSNSYGVGGRVRIVAGGSAQIREIVGGFGYHSQEPLSAYFGLGSATTVDTVEVRWPGMGSQVLTGIASDQTLVVTEDVSGTRVDPEIPLVFRLYANRPNPFSSVTSIRYDLPVRSRVNLKVYDVSGRLVRTLIDGNHIEPGRHTAHWNGRNADGRPVAPGIYFCRIGAGGWMGIQRMVLLK